MNNVHKARNSLELILCLIQEYFDSCDILDRFTAGMLLHLLLYSSISIFRGLQGLNWIHKRFFTKWKLDCPSRLVSTLLGCISDISYLHITTLLNLFIISIVAPCIWKIYWVSHTNKCTGYILYIGCPTCYRTWHFFNNFTTGWRTAAPCRNN
jgi:hypothetical protein